MYKRILRIGIMVVVALGLIAAWEDPPNYVSSPYTGNYSKQTLVSGYKTLAGSIKWNTAGVNAIKSNIWVEFFDQTADCVAPYYTGDRLRAEYVISNLPNSGAFSYNDCDGPLPNVNEEVEVTVASGSVVAEASYQYDVVWACNTRNPTSGEFNITFELGAIGSKDHLDKETYSWQSCAVLAPSGSEQNVEVDSPTLRASSSPVSRELIATKMDSSGAFGYQILRTSGGSLRARVHVNFLEPSNLQVYRELNLHLAKSLMQADDPVFVVVAFRSPLSKSEAKNLVEQTGLVVLSYGAVGTNATEEQVSVYHWPLTQTIDDLPAIEGIHLDGIMTISGSVSSGASSLASLLGDERVFLVDVVSNEVKELIEGEMGEPIRVDQIGVPNPSWFIASGEINGP